MILRWSVTRPGITAAAAVVLAVSASHLFSQGLPVAKPSDVGMDALKLERIEELVMADIAAKKLPGAVVLAGRKGKIVYRKAFGSRSLVPTVEPMTVDTIFDVASLTKPVATATSIMILVEQGKLQLRDTIGKFIPEIEDEDIKRATILQLLTHTSGLRPSFNLSEKWSGRDGMLTALRKEKALNPPGTKFVYSDVGFIVLGEIIERVSGVRLDEFSSSVNFTKISNGEGLGFRLIGVRLDSPMISEADFLKAYGLTRVAPTETRRGQQSYSGSSFSGETSAGDRILRGDVHDPTAYRMGGVAGHAGLFSTADDLGRFCQMILNGGVVPKAEGRMRNERSIKKVKDQKPNTGQRILSARTVAIMTRPYVVSETGQTRGLGWDMDTAFSRNRGELFPPGSFGHTGFTGTSIWIDPTSQTFVVFLSNRVHPDGKGDVGDLRAKISTVVASSITDIPPERWREAEARYYAAVNAQIAAFPKTPKP